MKNKMKHIATAAALGVVALLASCVSRQVAVEVESRSDSLELVVSAKDSLINAVFADINAISENLALIKSRENLITVAGESEGGRRPVEEIDNDIKAIDRLLRENRADRMRLLSAVDVLVDGPFRSLERSLALLYRGSKNQRLIDMPATLKSGTIRLYAPPEW